MTINCPAGPAPACGPELLAIGDREAVLAEFQATMQRFLETQQNVMLAYLSGAAASHRPARPPSKRRDRDLSRSHPAPIIAPPPRAAVLEPSLHIKRIGGHSCPAALGRSDAYCGGAAPVNGIHTEPHAAAGGPTKNGGNGAARARNAPARKAANGSNGSNGHGGFGKPALTDLLLGLVEDRTGYPRDMLGMDQNLEADLGIDFDQAGRDRRRASEGAAGRQPSPAPQASASRSTARRR